MSCLTTLVLSWSNQTCLHMVFMAHMKLCTKTLYSVLGLGYSHMVTKVNKGCPESENSLEAKDSLVAEDILG